MIVSNPILDNASETPFFYQFLRTTQRRKPAKMVRHPVNFRRRALLQRFSQRLGFVGPRDDRFFAIDVLIGADRLQERGQVLRVRGADVNDVDLRIRD